MRITSRYPALALLAAVVAVGAGAVADGAPVRGAAHPKRGVASSRYLAAQPAVLSRLRASWAYDWSAAAPAARGGPEWVPMVWGPGSVRPRVMRALGAAARSGRVRYLLGFNEPDSGSQSNVSPERAAALWPQLQATGLALGSPAPAVPGDGWLARFMALARARRLRVDFIALHYYQDFTDPGAVSSLRRQLVAIHRQYRLPIWITEIGAMDIRRWHEPMRQAPSAGLAAAYMRRLFAMLDGLAFVARYAWFTDYCWNDVGCRQSSLIGPDGRPTEAGSAFADAP